MKEYWKNLNASEKRDLARVTGTTPEYLRQVFIYGRKVSHHLAQRLEKATGVPRYELRPDIYPPEEYKKAG